MKKVINLILLLVTFISYAQVKIGDNPTSVTASAALELESTNKALVVTRVANTAAITAPVNGMIVYDISSNCIKAFENGTWSNCLSSVGSNGTANNCNASVIVGEYTTGVAMSNSNYVLIKLQNDSLFTITNVIGPSDITLSGANAGLSVEGVAVGSFNGANTSTVTLIAGESKNLFYKLQGTPTANGSLTITWNKNNLQCIKNITIFLPNTIDPSSAQSVILTMIGHQADTGGPSTTTFTQFETLNLTGLIASNIGQYQLYIASNPNSFSLPATLQEVQTMVNFVNAHVLSLYAIIGQQADSGGPSTTTAADFISLNLSNVIPANSMYYQNYIATHPNSFSSPATFSEVQAMINLVNSQSVILATIGQQADAGGPSSTTIADFYTLELTNVTPANQSAYQSYIATNPNSFSSPATIAEVQTMIILVNQQVAILTTIGQEADAGGPSTTTISNLLTLQLSGVVSSNLSLYQTFIETNANFFSNPATIAQVQNMINLVNSQVIEPSYTFNEALLPTPNRWMTHLPGYLKLSQLDIPGTHDSGALFDSPYYSDTAKCQYYGIADQLNLGVRYLDIRCRMINDRFTIHHGQVYQNMNYAEVLTACRNFLIANPNEVIMMAVKREHTIENCTKSFDQIFADYVLENPNLFYIGDNIPTLEQSRGKIVVLRQFNWYYWNTPNVTPFGINTTPAINNTPYHSFYTGYSDEIIATQNNYEHSSENAKWPVFVNFYRKIVSSNNDNTLILNFGSGIKMISPTIIPIPGVPSIPQISSVANATNPKIKQHFSHRMARYHKSGVTAVDFVDTELAKIIYKNNFWANANFDGNKSIVLYQNSVPEIEGSIRILSNPGMSYGAYYRFDISDLEWLGYSNDTLSSIMLGSNVQETILYNNAGYGGSSITITTTGFTNIAPTFNDATSSLLFRL